MELDYLLVVYIYGASGVPSEAAREAAREAIREAIREATSAAPVGLADHTRYPDHDRFDFGFARRRTVGLFIGADAEHAGCRRNLVWLVLSQHTGSGSLELRLH